MALLFVTFGCTADGRLPTRGASVTYLAGAAIVENTGAARITAAGWTVETVPITVIGDDDADVVTVLLQDDGFPFVVVYGLADSPMQI